MNIQPLHRPLRHMAEREGIRFIYLPVTKDTKSQQEAALLKIVEETQTDLVVLAPASCREKEIAGTVHQACNAGVRISRRCCSPPDPQGFDGIQAGNIQPGSAQPCMQLFNHRLGFLGHSGRDHRRQNGLQRQLPNRLGLAVGDHQLIQVRLNQQLDRRLQ